MSRWAFAAVVALVLVACSPAAVGTTAPPAAAPTRTAGPAFRLSGVAKTGVSGSVKLAGGDYKIDWTLAAVTDKAGDKSGCYLALFLSPKADGPIVESVTDAMLSGPVQSGTAEWTGVPAGTYIMQEDRSGLSNCTGDWTATLTPR